MSDELGRRQFIRKAAVAGAIVWTVPTIVSIDPANAADRGSAKPRPPVSHPPVYETGGAAFEMGPALPAKLPGSLPFTGDNEQLGALIGGGAVVAGIALVAKGGRTRPAIDK